jgi:hypothetical protein
MQQTKNMKTIITREEVPRALFKAFYCSSRDGRRFFYELPETTARMLVETGLYGAEYAS